MQQSKALTNGDGQAAIQPGKSVPLTRDQIVQRLAEAAGQKRAARVAAEIARETGDTGEAWKERTVQVLRSWLSE